MAHTQHMIHRVLIAKYYWNKVCVEHYKYNVSGTYESCTENTEDKNVKTL